MISLLCPTRKRPGNLKRLVDSVLDTSAVVPEILCYVTEDDHSYEAFPFPEVKFVRGPRLIMSDLWNALIPHARGEILMQCADDVIFRTPAWDLVVEKAFEECPDKILLAFGDDMGPSGKIFATLPFVHRKWIETVGYFTGPGFSSDFSDAWPQDVADMIGRKKLLPIQIEHMHWLWGKAVKDQVYIENQERLARDQCGLQYERRLPERQADAEKLRKAMNHS